MPNLMQYFTDFYQYSKDCSLLLLPFASCTTFWGILYFILAIFLVVGFIKIVALIYARPYSQKSAKKTQVSTQMQKATESSQQWQDSAFAEFSHERILQKFHKELHEK